jgi:homoserine kinase type II
VSFVVDGRERIIVTFCVDLPLERVERLASLLQHLQQHGLESNRLLRSRVGNLVEVVGGVPTIVKSFLEGSVLRVVDQARAHGIGGVLSQLHEVPIPTGYAADHAMNRNNMASIGEAADDPSFSGWLLSALADLPLNWADLPMGIVHGDLFPDNLIEVEGGALVPIDFEEACLYPLVFDLGMTLVGFANVDSLSSDTAAALLAGYQVGRKLSESELSALPTMVEYAALATVCWRYELGQRGAQAPGELRNWRDAQATHRHSLEWRRTGVWSTLLSM